MLPGLRFLFAASLLTASLLVFGMGAIALLRASHQQVANLTAQPAPEPVFAQAPETVPSLSVLRVEAATAEAAPIAADAGRLAALTEAVRESLPFEAPAPLEATPPPVMAEPQPAAPAPEIRSDAAPEPEPVAAAEMQPQAAPAETTIVATAPAAAPLPQAAEVPPPAADITGSTTPKPVVTESTKPLVANPPLPQARPVAANQIAALTPTATAMPKVAAVKKARVFKRRYVRRARERLPPATSSSSNPLSSLFGGGN